MEPPFALPNHSLDVSKTITDRDELIKEFEQIQARGYAVDNEEFNIHPVPGTSGPYNNGMAYIDGELIGVWDALSFKWLGKDWLGTKRFESQGQSDSASTAVPTYPTPFTSLPFGDGLSSIASNAAVAKMPSCSRYDKQSGNPRQEH